MQTWHIRDCTLRLLLSPAVFTPSFTSLFVAQNFIINAGDTVFDVGCGTGFFSILASKLGAASVVGSDINKEAVILARRNAGLNGLTNATFFAGEFFGSKKGRYDAILSNIPQAPIPPDAKMEEWRLDGNGGRDGTGRICRLLQAATMHLQEDGRLYVPLLSFSNPQKTMRLMRQHYHLRKIAETEMPIDFRLLSRLPYFLQLKQEGKCEVYQKRDDLWYCKEELYELRPR